MVVMTRIRKRAIWLGWRLRYWALWKYRKWALAGALTAGMIALVQLIVACNRPPPGDVRLAYDPWTIVYIILLIISMIISYANRPKPPDDPTPGTANAPQVKDGAAVCRIYGTVWFDDSVVLGWRQEGVSAIETSGGKK